MKKITHNKLVRDKIPNILIKYGLAFKASHVSGPRMRVVLADKLIEEATEVRDKIAWFDHLSEQEPMSNRECDAHIEAIKEEMADVLEVFMNLAKQFELKSDDLLKAVEAKRKTRGAFDDGIFLEWAEDANKVLGDNK